LREPAIIRSAPGIRPARRTNLSVQIRQRVEQSSEVV
jgi:hypothetical protein